MIDTNAVESPEQRAAHEAQRGKVIRQRNIAMALALGFFVVLFFAITIVKMKV